jgi:RES domain-containing protein
MSKPRCFTLRTAIISESSDMALVWRLVPPDFAATLDGKGNIERGARWNSPGRGVVYTSINLSLCVLESLAQMPPPLRMKLPELAAVRIDFPVNAPSREVELADLPVDLGVGPGRTRCREIGDEWLAEDAHLVLRVPSVIVPQECNVLINPAHRLMETVKIVSIERFRFDARLAVPPPR